VSKCPFPEHHQSSGGGFDPAPLLIVIGVLFLASSGAVASAVHALLVAAGITAGVLIVALVAFIAWRLRRRARPARPVMLTARPVRPAVRPARQGRPAVGGRVLRAIESPRDDVPTYQRVHVDPHDVTRRAILPRRTRRDGRRS
jgi:hypothetical protein